MASALVRLVVAALVLVSGVSAHYSLYEPYWRANSLEGNFSQWIWPCAGVPQTFSQNNRTLWPLTGGSVKTKFGHEWAITYINLGLGNVVTGFNVSLVEGFNQTGSGDFCFPEVGRAALAELDIQEGTNASIQVIQISHSGASLYNCADITFSSKGSLLDSSQCQNGTGVGGVALESDEEGSDEEGSASALGHSPVQTLIFAVIVTVMAGLAIA